MTPASSVDELYGTAPAASPSAGGLAPWGSPLTSRSQLPQAPPVAQAPAPSPAPPQPSPAPSAPLADPWRVDLVALPSGDVLARTPAPSRREAMSLAEALLGSLADAPSLRALSRVFAVRTLVRTEDGWSLVRADIATDDAPSPAPGSPSLPSQEARA